MALNRDYIVNNVMGQQAILAGQLVPSGTFGYDPSLKPVKNDLMAAKALLEQAAKEDVQLSYLTDGFRITLHGPNNRYINDAVIASELATQLTQFGVASGINIQAKAVGLGFDEYVKRASYPTYEFSVMLFGWAADTGEASISLKNLLATRDYEPGWGSANRGRYSNAQLDQITAQASSTLDDAARETLVRAATEIGIQDVGIIPLHFQMNNWATRKGISYNPRIDEHTHAFEVN